MARDTRGGCPGSGDSPQHSRQQLFCPLGMGKWDLNHAGPEAGPSVQKWLIMIFKSPLPFPSLAQGQG